MVSICGSCLKFLQVAFASGCSSLLGVVRLLSQSLMYSRWLAPLSLSLLCFGCSKSLSVHDQFQEGYVHWSPRTSVYMLNSKKNMCTKVLVKKSHLRGFSNVLGPFCNFQLSRGSCENLDSLGIFSL